MLPELLEFNHHQDPHAIAKFFFNSLWNGSFPEDIRYILNGTGFGNEYNGCWFPESQENESKSFTGVKFSRLEEELILTESESLMLVKEACLAFIKLYLDRAGEVMLMLNEIENRLTTHPINRQG